MAIRYFSINELQRIACEPRRKFMPLSRVWISAEKRGESREKTAGEWRKAERVLFGSPFSSLLFYCRGAAIEAATKTRNGYHIGALEHRGTMPGTRSRPTWWTLPTVAARIAI